MTSRRIDLPIFFVVSKLEPEDRTKSSDEDDEPSGHAPLVTRLREFQVQSRKKQRVHERLVKHGHLSSKVDMNQNERFHGLSAWRIQQYHEAKRGGPDACTDAFTDYVEAFARFQNCLKKFTEESLRARVESACKILIRVLSRCLDFFIQKANTLKKDKKIILETFKTLLREEKEVYDNISHSLDEKAEEIQDLLGETINKVRDDILKEAENFEYVSTEFIIPQDGFVKQKEVVGYCRSQLQRMVVNKLQGEIKEMLIMMFNSRDLFVIQLKDRMAQIQNEIEAKGDMPSAALALGNSLLSIYEAQITFSKGDNAALRFIKKLAMWFYDVYCDRGTTFVNTVIGKVQVGSKKWKKGVASSVLGKVDPSEVAKEIVSSLKQHFFNCHEEFTGEIGKVQDLFDRGATIKDKQRETILEFAPNLALLEMQAYGIMDRLKFGLPTKGELIGRGTQGGVYACDSIKTPGGRSCVVKVVAVSSEEVLKDVSLELHYNRSLRHPNILPILCTTVEGNATRGQSVSVVSERMRCNLQEGLTGVPSLRKRLEMALDVAKALQYLHAEELIHRDVKMQNVLLDAENNVKLTDLGLWKAEGFISNSLVRMSKTMITELINQQSDKTVDVYAFGMLLWRVCEGQGNQPQNMENHVLPLMLLIMNSADNKTPEKLDVIPRSCWELMEKCWNRDPQARPSFDTVVKDLEEILLDRSIR